MRTSTQSPADHGLCCHHPTTITGCFPKTQLLSQTQMVGRRHHGGAAGGTERVGEPPHIPHAPRRLGAQHRLLSVPREQGEAIGYSEGG